MDHDIADLRASADHFKARIAQAKRDLGPVDFEWYPHDSFSSFSHLDRLLTGPNRRLFATPQSIVDLGCQDGEVSFFLESAGHRVTAVDYPAYNHNCMRGVRALKQTLGSSIELREADLDRRFSLSGQSYSVALLFGVLYHLRSPFYVLDEIARHSDYCLMSTRIARCLPDGASLPAGAPLAYMLGEWELNRDDTNYFIFSEPALRVLIERTHWRLCDYLTAGYTAGDSDPVRPDRDERAFCLLQSTYGRIPGFELLNGWHPPEESGWRWTERNFSVRVDGANARTLVLDLFVSEQLLSDAKSLTLSIAANGQALSPEVLAEVGPHQLVRHLPHAESVDLRFSLDRCMPPDDRDPRERGIVVNSIRVE